MGRPWARALTCTITVRFAPGTAGDKSGTLKVASTNAVNGNVAVPLSGLGVAAPSSVSITPNPYDFGQVERGLTVNRTFTFHNNGVGSVHVVSVDKASGSSAFTIPSGNDECSGDNGRWRGTCTFRVSFKAPTTTDIKHARIDVSGTGFAVESLDVTGQGVPFVAKVDSLHHPGHLEQGLRRPGDLLHQGLQPAVREPERLPGRHLHVPREDQERRQRHRQHQGPAERRAAPRPS